MNIILAEIGKEYEKLLYISKFYTKNNYEAEELLHFTIDFITFNTSEKSKSKMIDNNIIIPYFITVMKNFSKTNRYGNIITYKKRETLIDYDTVFDVVDDEYSDDIEERKQEKRDKFVAIVKEVLNNLVKEELIHNWKRNLFVSYYFDNNVDELITKYRLTDVMINKTKAEVESILFDLFKKEL